MEYMTSDLALASFLSMKGLTLARFFTDENDPRTAFFVFVLADGDEINNMDYFVDQYEQAIARVEPKRFLREVGVMRNKMYDYLRATRAS